MLYFCICLACKRPAHGKRIENRIPARDGLGGLTHASAESVRIQLVIRVMDTTCDYVGGSGGGGGGGPEVVGV